MTHVESTRRRPADNDVRTTDITLLPLECHPIGCRCGAHWGTENS